MQAPRLTSRLQWRTMSYSCNHGDLAFVRQTQYSTCICRYYNSGLGLMYVLRELDHIVSALKLIVNSHHLHDRLYSHLFRPFARSALVLCLQVHLCLRLHACGSWLVPRQGERCVNDHSGEQHKGDRFGTCLACPPSFQLWSWCCVVFGCQPG